MERLTFRNDVERAPEGQGMESMLVFPKVEQRPRSDR